MGRVGAAMQKWGLVDSANCECRDPLQTVEHVITSGPKHRPPNGDWGLIDLDDETLDWLALMELKVGSVWRIFLRPNSGQIKLMSLKVLLSAPNCFTPGALLRSKMLCE